MKSQVLRIYIAGPYSSSDPAEVEQNVRNAVRAGVALLHKGHYPYIPHLTHYVELLSKNEGLGLEWEDYIDWDIIWLEACDSILYLGSSKGADIELDYAKRCDKKIFYSVEEVPTLPSRRHNLDKLMSEKI